MTQNLQLAVHHGRAITPEAIAARSSRPDSHASIPCRRMIGGRVGALHTWTQSLACREPAGIESCEPLRTQLSGPGISDLYSEF